jgi:hypothetical protein
MMDGDKAGSKLTFEKAGVFTGLDELYSAHASANVLCEHDVEEMYDVLLYPWMGHESFSQWETS